MSVGWMEELKMLGYTIVQSWGGQYGYALHGQVLQAGYLWEGEAWQAAREHSLKHRL